MSATPEEVQPAHRLEQPAVDTKRYQARRDAEPGLHEGTRRPEGAPIKDLGHPRPPHTRASSAAGVAALQRTVGNRAVSGMLAAVQRQPAQQQSPPTPTGAMTRARFVELLSTR